MSPRYQRAADLLELKNLLQATLVGLTMDEIADHFEVSRRTAERMVNSIRDRFPGAQAEFRDGKKYWSLRFSTAVQPLELPSNLARLSSRVRKTSSADSNLEGQSDEHAIRTIKDDILGQSAIGIFVLDADFRVVWVNDSLGCYFGLEPAQVIGRDKRDLIRDRIRNHFEDPDYFQQRVLATYEDNTYIEHFQCHVLPAPGREERWLEHWSQPIEAGPYTGGRVEHYVDVTKRARDQTLRRRELKELQSRLVESQTSGRQAQTADAVAHSIRSPLAEILAIAKRNECGIGDEGSARDIQLMAELARRMGDSVDQMLRRHDPEPPIFEATNPRRLIERVARELGLICDLTEIEVNVEIAPGYDEFEFDSDPQRLRRAICEILENAVRVMPNGGCLTLAVQNGVDPGHIRFRILDTGPGVPQDLRSLIFEDFYTTWPEGAGTGLAVARRIAGEHRGTLGLEEDQDSGSCFYIEMPISQTSA